MPNQNLKGDILEATIQAFQKKGLKFTMDDLASLLGISKKTIYTVFPDKKSKNRIIRINTGILSNMKQKIKEFYH